MNITLAFHAGKIALLVIQFFVAARGKKKIGRKKFLFVAAILLLAPLPPLWAGAAAFGFDLHTYRLAASLAYSAWFILYYYFLAQRLRDAGKHWLWAPSALVLYLFNYFYSLMNFVTTQMVMDGGLETLDLIYLLFGDPYSWAVRIVRYAAFSCSVVIFLFAAFSPTQCNNDNKVSD
jgi:uncharacterized membrane protein YhaH (DUF805 family)